MHEEPLDAGEPSDASSDPAFPQAGAADVACWIRAAQGGSNEAFDELFTRCRGYLLSVANAEIPADLRRKTRASSVVQQTLITVHQCFARFEGNTEQELLAWMRGILRRQIDDLTKYFRRARRNIGREVSLERDLQGDDRGGLVAAEQMTPGFGAARDEEARMLVLAMESLPTDYRTVIVLRNWQCLPFGKVGEQMQRSSEAARKLWTRAIDALGRELERTNGRDVGA